MTTISHLRQSFKALSIRSKSKFCLTCLVIILLGIWAWEDIIKDNVIPRRFGVVEDGQLYRSGLISAGLVKKVLSKYKIKVIIDLADESPVGSDLADNPPDGRNREATERAAAEMCIERLTFLLKGDGTGDINDYAGAITAIVKAKRENKPVLVHCNAGVKRTGGVIAAYQMLVERKAPSCAYREYTRYDRSQWNNMVLFNYINSHMEELAVLLKKMGVINEIPSPLPVFGPDIEQI
jgi:hypothetical protein